MAKYNSWYCTSENEKNKIRALCSRKKEVKQKEKKIINLHQALDALNACFTINKNVKQKAYEHYTIQCDCGGWCDRCYGLGVYDWTTVDYNLRDSEYRIKTKIIQSVVNGIKNNRLPIKYGKSDGIIYFEYCGRQVSFHDPKNQINCKPFQGEWSQKTNKTIPFEWVK